jgi:D-arabinose 1-dehydrogenase-like Zn-dependent alcohol dehydrogenase
MVDSSSKQWYLGIIASNSKQTTKGRIMKAVQFHEVGGPEVLQYVETEQPAPVAGQVRLRVAASAFNAADNGMRAGFLPIPVVLPHVPGYDSLAKTICTGSG